MHFDVSCYVLERRRPWKEGSARFLFGRYWIGYAQRGPWGKVMMNSGRNTRELLAAEGVRAAVVSMPCTSLFDQQTGKYRREVLGGARMPRVVVEAGVRQGWEPYLGANGAFVGMSGFGASAPAGDLYKHFGITPEAVAAAAKKLL